MLRIDGLRLPRSIPAKYVRLIVACTESSSLLRIKPDQVIAHRKSLARERESYLGEIEHRGDIFLDPDTGIATSKCKQIKKYIRANELAALMTAAPGRVIAVYQHVRAVKACVRVDGCLAVAAKGVAPFTWCSYESPTVAMLFLSRDPDRILAIEKTLKGLLGRHATGRVRNGSK